MIPFAGVGHPDDEIGEETAIMGVVGRLLDPSGPARRYAAAVLAAGAAVAARGLLDPLLEGDHALVLPLLAVVFIAWRHGFWPALVSLLLSVSAVIYLFIEPRQTFAIASLHDRIAVGLFLLAGVCCALLGESQRRARRRDEQHAADLRARQEELAASEERYRFLAETLPALVWSSRPDGATDYRNGRWYEYTGLPRGSADGSAAAVHPDDRARAAERWQRAVETGTRYQNEYRLRRADGAYRWFLAQALPMRSADGRVVRWFGTDVDIDDQMRLQLELRQSLDRFRALTEAIPQLVFTTDPDGRVTFFNRRWIDYTGLTVDQAGDGGWSRAAHPDDAGKLADRWAKAVGTGAEWFSAECRLRRASDREYRWHLAYAVPLRDAEGRTVQWVGALTDIDSQRRQAELLERLVAERTIALRQEVDERGKAEELARATAAELARSNAELEQFAYVASHDLQEPLRKIQAFGGRLKLRHRDRLDDQGRDYLDRVLAAAGRMRRLIEDLLALSRVTTKGQPFARVDLNVIAEGVVSDLESRAQEVDATIDVGPLPAIDADPTQIRQLLQNLIGNALKFHRPGVPPVVTVRAEVIPAADGPEDRTVCRVTVSDNGIGFEEKYLDRIFQVFQRLHGRQEYEGTGVGLAICRKIVERHGGAVTAQSTPGAGTTFVVTLPTRQPTPTHGEPQ
jgi:PAS domain S-box-containing protein